MWKRQSRRSDHDRRRSGQRWEAMGGRCVASGCAGGRPGEGRRAVTDLLLRSTTGNPSQGRSNRGRRDRPAGSRGTTLSETQSKPWAWSVDLAFQEGRHPTHGFEATREAAMQAFAKLIGGGGATAARLPRYRGRCPAFRTATARANALRNAKSVANIGYSSKTAAIAVNRLPIPVKISASPRFSSVGRMTNRVG